jgi:predicted negative regulator of RcsB-dependent stress response
MFNQYKIYILLGAFAASNLFTAWATYQVQSGKNAKKEIQVIIEKVDNHNEDIITLAKHSETIAKMEREFERSIRAIPRVNTINNCSVDEFKRVYNEANRAANSMSIEN